MGFYADPPGKPPLLLMHGFLSSRNHWRLNEERLRSRYRLIIAELPGHGETKPEGPVDVSPEVLVDAIEAARIALDIPCWHLCGQSFGAGLTIRYALRFPQHVGAMVWTNSNRIITDPLSTEGQQALTARADAIEIHGLEGIRRERVYPGKARYFPEEIRQILAQDADGSDPAIMVDIIRKAVGHVSVGDRLKDLTVPTLLINGFRERSFQQWRHRAAELLPTMEIIDLDGGHSINIEQAEAFNSASLEFLARHDHLLAQEQFAGNH